MRLCDIGGVQALANPGQPRPGYHGHHAQVAAASLQASGGAAAQAGDGAGNAAGRGEGEGKEAAGTLGSFSAAEVRASVLLYLSSSGYSPRLTVVVSLQPGDLYVHRMRSCGD